MVFPHPYPHPVGVCNSKGLQPWWRLPVVTVSTMYGSRTEATWTSVFLSTYQEQDPWGQHSHQRTELRDRALLSSPHRWLPRGIFLQTYALPPPHCTWSLTTIDSPDMAQWNTA